MVHLFHFVVLLPLNWSRIRIMRKNGCHLRSHFKLISSKYTYLFKCLAIKGLLCAATDLTLLSVTVVLGFLTGGWGGGPRLTLVTDSLTEFEFEFDSCCCCFFCFFSVKVLANSALKSPTAEPVELLMLVFWGLPIDDADDGDSLGGDRELSTQPIKNPFLSHQIKSEFQPKKKQHTSSTNWLQFWHRCQTPKNAT